MISYADLARRFNLQPQTSNGLQEYIGPNPFEPGAREDGFALFAEGEYAGSAFDRSLSRTYSSRKVAELAGIPYNEYEGSLTDPKANHLAPTVAYDERSLEERGLNQAARKHFKISGPRDVGSKWGEKRSFPTFYPNGKVGRHRNKYRYPARQLATHPDKTPRKGDWDNPTKDLGQPVCYGANHVRQGDEVWLVNSELAVWLYWQEGVTAVCPLGESRNEKTYGEIIAILRAAGAAKIHVLLDNDAAGRKASVRVWKALQNQETPWTIYDLSSTGKPKYDASDLWEYYGENLRGTPDYTFKRVLLDQQKAGAAVLRSWEALSNAPKPAEGAEKLIDAAKRVAADTKPGAEGSKKDVASDLVRQLRAHQLFKTDDGDYCIVVERRGRMVTFSLQSEDFKRWLRYRFLGQDSAVLKKETVEQVVASLCAVAAEEGATIKAFYRSGYLDRGRIFIDLANDAGQVVEIDAAGWRIQTNSPVFFRQADVIQELPAPVATPADKRGEVWNKYKSLINYGEERNWVLMVAWLVSALVPAWWDCPMLMFSGQQGSAKSTATRLLRNLVDPNEAYMVINSSEEKDVVINAEKGRCFCLDNQSKMPDWLSDLLSAMITGTPYSCRKLFTDDGQKIFSGQRAMILNGIPETMGRSDLADRGIKIALPVITEDVRKDKTEVDEAWEELRPAVLGLILDVMSLGLRNWERRNEITKGYGIPRMADFFKWVMCCEDLLPFEPGAFYDTYASNIKEAARADLEGFFPTVVLAFCNSVENGFKADAATMYEVLTRQAVTMEESTEEVEAIEGSHAPEGEKQAALSRLRHRIESDLRKTRGWPATSVPMGTMLSRLAPSLRKSEGIDLRNKRSSAGMTWQILRVEGWVPPGEATEPSSAPLQGDLLEALDRGEFDVEPPTDAEA